MTMLYPKNYVKPDEPAKEVLDEVDVKAKVTAFVVKPEEYKTVVEHVQSLYISENKHYKDEDILAIVKELDLEWNPPKAALEEV